jgi:hypothetical protein
MGEAGDDGLDENPYAVSRCLNDNTLEFVIPIVLPLGLDADAVADFQDIQFFVAHHAPNKISKMGYGDNLKVHELQKNLAFFAYRGA